MAPVGLGVFLLAWLVMPFRYSWLGVAACLAGFVQLMLTLVHVWLWLFPEVAKAFVQTPPHNNR